MATRAILLHQFNALFPYTCTYRVRIMARAKRIGIPTLKPMLDEVRRRVTIVGNPPGYLSLDPKSGDQP